jgi:UDP-glucuronate decarboxylase
MRTNDGRVVPNFLTQAHSGQDLTIYGDGSQTRSFCFVSDLVRGVRRLAELPPEDGNGAVVNIGSTNEITIETLAETILDIVDTNSGIVYEPLPENDPQRRRPDIGRARDLIDWEPTVSLRTGLQRTLESVAEEL